MLQQHCSGSRLPSSTLAIYLKNELSRRFSSIEAHHGPAVSTLLEPRFKKLPFADKTGLESIVRRLTQEISAILLGDSDNGPSESCNPSTEQTDESSASASIWDSFDKKK